MEVAQVVDIHLEEGMEVHHLVMDQEAMDRNPLELDSVPVMVMAPVVHMVQLVTLVVKNLFSLVISVLVVMEDLTDLVMVDLDPMQATDQLVMLL